MSIYRCVKQCIIPQLLNLQTETKTPSEYSSSIQLSFDDDVAESPYFPDLPVMQSTDMIHKLIQGVFSELDPNKESNHKLFGSLSWCAYSIPMGTCAKDIIETDFGKCVADKFKIIKDEIYYRTHPTKTDQRADSSVHDFIALPCIGKCFCEKVRDYFYLLEWVGHKDFGCDLSDCTGVYHEFGVCHMPHWHIKKKKHEEKKNTSLESKLKQLSVPQSCGIEFLKKIGYEHEEFVTSICPRNSKLEGLNTSDPEVLKTHFTTENSYWNFDKLESTHSEYCEMIGDDIITSETIELNTFLMWCEGIGAVLSMMFLIPAIVILLGFKKLWNTRNFIHSNLMIAFVLKLSHSIATYVLLQNEGYFFDVDDTFCKILNVLRKYGKLASHFWLLNEGVNCYLYVNIMHHNQLRFSVYFVIGWILPGVIMVFYTYFRSIDVTETTTLGNKTVNSKVNYCWFQTHNLDGLTRMPIVICILINFALFFSILGTIFSKFRTHEPLGGARYSDSSGRVSSGSRRGSVNIPLNNLTGTRGNQTGGVSMLNSMQSMNNSYPEFKKLVKKTLFLMVILGMHHAAVCCKTVVDIYIVIANPFHKDPEVLKNMVIFLNCLSSLEGLAIAVSFCFTNKKVQRTLRKALQKTIDNQQPDQRVNARTSVTSRLLGSSVFSNPFVAMVSTPLVLRPTFGTREVFVGHASSSGDPRVDEFNSNDNEEDEVIRAGWDSPLALNRYSMTRTRNREST